METQRRMRRKIISAGREKEVQKKKKTKNGVGAGSSRALSRRCSIQGEGETNESKGEKHNKYLKDCSFG